MVYTTTQGNLFSFFDKQTIFFVLTRGRPDQSSAKFLSQRVPLSSSPAPKATSSICSWFLLLGLWHDPKTLGLDLGRKPWKTLIVQRLMLVSYSLGKMDLCDVSRYRRGR